MSRLTYMVLSALLAAALLSIAWHVAEAGRLRPPADLACPDPDASRDADGCPEGTWGFVLPDPDPELPLPPRTRAEVCAEIVRRCAE